MISLPAKWHRSWDGLVLSPSFQDEIEKVSAVVGDVSYHPLPENVFRFLDLDLAQVRCIIVGMDPYASTFEDASGNVYPQATGRSFEVTSLRIADDWDVKFKQSSLQNIVKAIYLSDTGQKASLSQIREKIASKEFSLAPPADLFDGLERQGVMFLNSALTVESGKPGSHIELWEEPMDSILQYVEDATHPTWMLWGKDAQYRVREALDDDDVHIVLSCHPRLSSFVDEDPFSNIPGIDWTCSNEKI